MNILLNINQKNKTNRWIIDPIDGTSNFLNAIPQFAISIGYEENNQIKNGLIYDPIKNELFFAETGNGAFLNNSRIGRDFTESKTWGL